MKNVNLPENSRTVKRFSFMSKNIAQSLTYEVGWDKRKRREKQKVEGKKNDSGGRVTAREKGHREGEKGV